MSALHLKTLNKASGLSRPVKRSIVVASDYLVGIAAIVIAYSLRIGAWVLYDPAIGTMVLCYTVIIIPVFYFAGVYRAIFRYAGRGMMRTILRASAAYAALFGTVILSGVFEGVPRTTGLIQPIIFLSLIVFSRLLVRYLFVDLLGKLGYRGETRAVMIYGAGSAGQQIGSAMRSDPAFRLMGFIDDDRRLLGQHLDGIKVYHSSDLERLTEKLGVTDVLLAMPRLTRTKRRAIVRRMQKLHLKVKTLPPIGDIVEGRVTMSDIRDLEVEDLLGREVVRPNELLLGRTVVGKTVLITGAGGSIGSELARQILDIGAAKLVLFDVSEYALYAVTKELLGLRAQHDRPVEIVAILGSVLDEDLIDDILSQHRPQSVYHAAAYKHVPLVEANAVQGIRNNFLGTFAVARAAVRHTVNDFILISTDKAVRPTNVMGASKRASELAVQALAAESPQTKLSMVRFGNVLGSSGSVVPLFRSQIAQGGPITLTHRDVTRYFMTIPEAAQLVIQAGGLAKGGEVFVLDMGASVKIIELARTMVNLSGLTVKDDSNPDGDIAIEEVGLRPGEKLYEELLIGDNPQTTVHPRIMMAREYSLPLAKIEQAADILAGRRDEARFVTLLAELVPEFKRAEPSFATA